MEVSRRQPFQDKPHSVLDHCTVEGGYHFSTELGNSAFVAGLPFTGKVLNSPFVGLGETINVSKLFGGKGVSSSIPSIRFYAGLSSNKTFGASPSPGIAGTERWVHKLQYGIEFSIRDVASKLSGSGKTSGGVK